MKKTFLLVIVSIIGTVSFGQGSRPEFFSVVDASTVGYNLNIYMPDGNNVYKPGVIGIPYLDAEFSEGTLYLSDGKVVEDWKFRYNAYHDGMEFMDKNEKVYSLAYPDKMERLSIQGKEFVHLTYLVDGVLEKGYFAILFSGKDVTLYKKYVCSLVEPNYTTALDTGPKDARFSHDVEYYVVFGNENPHTFKLNRRKVSKLFEGKEKVMKNFMKDNNLSVKNEFDLVKVFNHYDNL